MGFLGSYHAADKSTNIRAAETRILKTKTMAKLIPQKWTFGDVQIEFPGRTNYVNYEVLLHKK